jgi:hypothetical protein
MNSQQSSRPAPLPALSNKIRGGVKSPHRPPRGSCGVEALSRQRAALHAVWCPLVGGGEGYVTVPYGEHYKLKHRVGVSTPKSYVCGCASDFYSYNPFSPLIHDDPDASTSSKKKTKEIDRCARSSYLRRKAQKIVKLLGVDQSLKAKSKLPSDFVCGSLRAKIRSIYSTELTPTQELSIKTATKVEVQPCPFCENLQKEKLIEYEKARLSAVEVDPDHLDRFAKAFAGNVPDGWNRRKTPYVPNGNSTLFASRREGGNWVDQSFSAECDTKLIYSSGKPRVVTLYSGYNVAVLTPLHHSLYDFLKRRSWLLVGDPTDERLRHTADGCEGQEWLSFDYEAATDNIKIAYVRRAIEVLIDKGEGLSADEERCLRVVSSLGFGDREASTGQPMGSPMSFPLLCLVNKTVVDLALSELLDRGQIRGQEWSRHRCLINGDDLLTKSTSSGDLVAAIEGQGSKVGLRVNKEKTMRSGKWAEINSTPFLEGKKQKKTNVSALWMGADVPDVVGFAHLSAASVRGFRMVLLANASRLARQKIKTGTTLPFARMECIVSSKRLRVALTSRPATQVPPVTNLFGVEPVPDGFCLTRTEVFDTVTAEVARVKKYGFWKGLWTEKRLAARARKSIEVIPPEGRQSRRGLFKILKVKLPTPEPAVLSCLARAWEYKRKEELRADEMCYATSVIVSDLSGIDRLVDAIKAWKLKRKLEAGPNEPPTSSASCLPAWGEFVSLSDA